MDLSSHCEAIPRRNAIPGIGHPVTLMLTDWSHTGNWLVYKCTTLETACLLRTRSKHPMFGACASQTHPMHRMRDPETGLPSPRCWW